MPSAAPHAPSPTGQLPFPLTLVAGRVPLLALALLGGCSPEHRDVPIKEVRTVDSQPPPLGASSADRFGSARRDMRAAPAQSGLQFTLPAGWQRAEPRQFRDVNLTAPGEVECWVSVLGPQEMRPNLDRWRDQLGLAPASEADVTALGRRSLLGGEALVADLTSSDGKERLIGLMLLTADEAVFVRIHGTPDAVEAQRLAFEGFCASLRRGETSSPSANSPAPAAPGELAWRAPAGWDEQPGSMFKLASFEITSATQAWISLLGGDGGGLAPNVARWCGQVGRSPMTAEEIDSLPQIEMLGRRATLVELTGDGQEQGLIVVVCPQPELERTIYIKLQGPLAEVKANESAFKQFCASIGTKEG